MNSDSSLKHEVFSISVFFHSQKDEWADADTHLMVWTDQKEAAVIGVNEHLIWNNVRPTTAKQTQLHPWREAVISSFVLL